MLSNVSYWDTWPVLRNICIYEVAYQFWRRGYPSRVLELGRIAWTGLQWVQQRVGKAEGQERLTVRYTYLSWAPRAAPAICVCVCVAVKHMHTFTYYLYWEEKHICVFPFLNVCCQSVPHVFGSVRHFFELQVLQDFFKRKYAKTFGHVRIILIYNDNNSYKGSVQFLKTCGNTMAIK